MLIPLKTQARMSQDGLGAKTSSSIQRTLAGLVMRNANLRPLVSASLLMGREKTIEERVAAVLRRPRVRASAPFTSAA